MRNSELIYHAYAFEEAEFIREAAFCGFLSLWGRFGKATIIGSVSEERLLTGVLL